MEQSINKPVKSRRTISQIYSLLDEYKNSNADIPTFCASHNICKATFHKWCSRYRDKHVNQNVANGFTTLQFAENNYASTVLFAEVKGIKIYQPVTASYLKELSLA